MVVGVLVRRLADRMNRLLGLCDRKLGWSYHLTSRWASVCSTALSLLMPDRTGETESLKPDPKR
jgi:hypothetical protein